MSIDCRNIIITDKDIDPRICRNVYVVRKKYFGNSRIYFVNTQHAELSLAFLLSNFPMGEIIYHYDIGCRVYYSKLSRTSWLHSIDESFIYEEDADKSAFANIIRESIGRFEPMYLSDDIIDLCIKLFGDINLVYDDDL